MRILRLFCFFILIHLLSCHSSKQKEVINHQTFISDTFKSCIYKKCQAHFNNRHLFYITITKTLHDCYLYIYPVYSKDFIDSMGQPFETYQYEKSLFLVYCGLEKMYKKDSLQEQSADSVFNYFSSIYPLENEKGVTHCEGPVIFKVVNDSVLSDNVAFDNVMYQFINGVREEKPFQIKR